MRVKLTRRWGTTPAGDSVDVDPVQGRWLVDNAFGAALPEPAPQPAPTREETAPDSPVAVDHTSSTEALPPASGGQPAKPRRTTRRKTAT